VIGSYGARTEYHPNRQVGRNRWPTPPLSEQPGRGVNAVRPAIYPEDEDSIQWAHPDVDYVVTTGGIHASVGRRVPDSPPQSEQPGRGALAPTADERASQWYQENLPQTISNMGPVGDLINDNQFVPS
jgi:hypothetical protein